jgi:hypothetical protein
METKRYLIALGSYGRRQGYVPGKVIGTIRTGFDAGMITLQLADGTNQYVPLCLFEPVDPQIAKALIKRHASVDAQMRRAGLSVIQGGRVLAP